MPTKIRAYTDPLILDKGSRLPTMAERTQSPFWNSLTAYLLAVLSESPLYMQFTGGFLLIVPSVLFIFLVRKQLFAMWGIANR